VPETKWIECDQSEHPLREAVVKEPIEFCRGEWLVPQAPGLGINVILPAAASGAV
jgi:D-galactarolactone cycloisomerase